MVPIGYRPVLWHVMKYYAALRPQRLNLCLGYRADAIKQFFLCFFFFLFFVCAYDECVPTTVRSQLAAKTSAV